MTRTDTHPIAPAGAEPSATAAVAGPRQTIQRHGVAGTGDGREPTAAAFAAWLDRQAEDYRSIGSDRGAWLARQIDQLARQARILGADSPSTFDDRLPAWEGALDPSEDPAGTLRASQVLRPDVAARVYRREPLPIIDDPEPDDDDDLDEIPAVAPTPDRHNQTAR